MDYSLINNLVNELPEKKKENILNAIKSRVDDGEFYEETHLHSKEQFEADNPPKEVVKVLKNQKRKAIFLTQNGVAAMTWDFASIAKENDMKFIPGVQTDYQKKVIKEKNGLSKIDKKFPFSNIVLHALNDQGWKAIGMAVSDSQTKDGRSLMSEEILKKYFGEGSIGHKNVVATTSSINGPISIIFQENEIAKRKVEGILKERNKKTGGEIPQSYIDKLTNKIQELNEENSQKKEEIKKQKKLANTKFTKKDKAGEALLKEYGADSETYTTFSNQLGKEKLKASQAGLVAEQLKEESSRLTKRISALNKELKAYLDIIEKNGVYSEEVEEVMANVSSDEVLEKKAKKELNKFNSIFGNGYFYVEIQNHGSALQQRIFPKIVSLARENSIPIIASNDVHLLNNSESEMLKWQILKSTKDPNNPKWFELTPAEKEMFFKSNDEMKESLKNLYPEDVVEESLLNTLFLTELSDVKFEKENHHPKFVDDTGRNSNEIFMDLIEEGIKKRFPEGLDEAHQKRLDHEVHIMKTMGYVDYHLVVNDFNQYASEYDAIPFDKIPEAPLARNELLTWKKENGYEVPVGLTNGTGRGSAVGSLVCDLLGITHLDPMKYELLFERFLNPERVSMPDIDSDISRTVRPIVIEYVKQKYGEDCVAGIMTQNSQAPKGAIRIAAKSYGLYLHRHDYKDNGAKKFLSLGDSIAKMVPEAPGTSFDSAMTDASSDKTVYQYLLEVFASNPDAIKIIEWAKNIEGVFTAYGSHAAGIVITDGTPVSEIVPLRWNDKLSLYTTQCDMVVAEEIGMLKFDMLGLKTVDIINDTLWEMYKSGVVMDTNKLPLDDEDVYREIFAKGKTDSVFQFESNGMKQMLKQFKPENFEDLIILVSMFRPGPLQYLGDVIDVKHGRKPLTFLTPELEPILGATYGAITYQEQVMQIFQQLAGYTLGGADLVRRFMSKKKADKLAKEREAFIFGDESRNIPGCVNNGIDKDAAAKLFDQMTDFAKYAFNKSHAAAYAYNAYITGYLKYHYPAEFMMAAMRWAEKTGSHDPLPGLIIESRSLGVEVLPPDINHSGVNFNVENGKILFGLGSVAAVASYANEIVEERKNGKYVDFFDYFKRTRAKKDSTKNLISAGAFDSFHTNRKAMLEIVEDAQKLAKKIKEKKRSLEIVKAMLPYINDLHTEQELADRQRELGYPVEIKKPTTAEKLSQKIHSLGNKIAELESEFASIKFSTSIKEDFDERLTAERKFIGAYITAHPLDGYESGKSLGIEPISTMTENTTVIYGLISSVDIRKKKSDGKPMAFLTVEDELGSVKVNVFSNVYPHYQNIIKVGAVVTVKGTTKISETDDEGNVVYEFNAKELTLSKKKERGLMANVNSIILFHLDDEEEFRKKYESPVGVPLYVYDKTLSELRLMNYKVSSEASKEDFIVEL